MFFSETGVVTCKKSHHTPDKEQNILIYRMPFYVIIHGVTNC